MAHIIYYATTLFLSATALLFVGQLLRQKRRLLPPGPMGLPVIGHLHLVGPFLHRTFHEWSLCHGPLIYVRLGSIPCVVASSPQLAKEMLKDNELAFTSRQTSGAIDLLTYKLSSVFSPIGGEAGYGRRGGAAAGDQGRVPAVRGGFPMVRGGKGGPLMHGAETLGFESKGHYCDTSLRGESEVYTQWQNQEGRVAWDEAPLLC